MRLTMKEQRTMTITITEQYRRSSKKKKGPMKD